MLEALNEACKEILKDKFVSIFLKFDQIDDDNFKSTVLASDETKELSDMVKAFETDKYIDLPELERAINCNLTRIKEAIYKFQNNN